MSIEVRPTGIYHPIKVIFLDDNRAFLDALELEFSSEINMLTFTDPAIVLQLIENSQSTNKSIFKLFNDVNVDNPVMDFQINNVLSHIYDETRFDCIPVLIVDYEMPEINGVEFCEKLKGKQIFKIMLTAEADKDTAIKAFNHGLIDKFILKTSKDLYQELPLSIQELTQRYFKELSSLHNISFNELFDNKLYLELFAKIAFEVQAVEFYLVDNSGSFLLLDKDANPTWFIVRNTKELDKQSELLQGYELPEHIIESIAKNEKILFLLSENDYKKPINEWVEKYMFNAKKLDNNHYYSIVSGQLTDSIDWGRVVSYSSHMQEKNCIPNYDRKIPDLS